MHLGAPPEKLGGSEDEDLENPLIQQSANTGNVSTAQVTSGERTEITTTNVNVPTQQSGDAITAHHLGSEPTVMSSNTEPTYTEPPLPSDSTAQSGGGDERTVQNSEDLPPLLNEVIEQQQLANSSNLMLDENVLDMTPAANSQSSSNNPPPTENSRSRPLVKVKRSKSVPPKVHLYKSCTREEINRVIELLKIPKDTRRMLFAKKASEKRRWFLQARRKKDKQLSKVVQVYPNKTNCAKFLK